MLWCPKCFNVSRVYLRDKESRKCTNEDCTGLMEHVDELMVPILNLLNCKGYITTGCCSGHLYGDGVNTYISFSVSINHGIPKGFNLISVNDQLGSVVKIEYMYFPKSMQEAMMMIANNWKTLYTWAESLPAIKSEDQIEVS